MKTSLVIFFLFLFQLTFGQKVEREQRITSERVPLKALEFIYKATESHKVKWYYEENEKGNSYEAKFTSNRKKVSVEFDLKGNLQDIEIEISRSKIPNTSKRSVKKFLKAYFKNFRIVKIQKQYRGETEVLQESLRTKTIFDASPTFYEIVVIGKKSKDSDMTEFLFDQFGYLISSKRIEQSNSDHLAY